MCCTPTSTPSCQQPDATLWLLHQHPVNQESSIFYGGVPWSDDFLRRVCVCVKLPRCAHANKCPKKTEKEEREKWYLYGVRMLRDHQVRLYQAIICHVFFFTMSWWFCLEVINLFFFRVFQFLTEIIDWLEIPATEDQNWRLSVMTPNSTLRYFYCQTIRSQGQSPGKS